MTMEFLNNLIDASIIGTLLGISISFWIFGLIAVWKWFLGIVKKMVHWLFPNLFIKKEAAKETENK